MYSRLFQILRRAPQQGWKNTPWTAWFGPKSKRLSRRQQERWKWWRRHSQWRRGRNTARQGKRGTQMSHAGQFPRRGNHFYFSHECYTRPWKCFYVQRRLGYIKRFRGSIISRQFTAQTPWTHAQRRTENASHARRQKTKGARNEKTSLARQGNKCGERGDVAVWSISRDAKPTSQGSRQLLQR